MEIARIEDWENLLATRLDEPLETWDSLRDTARFPTPKPTEPKAEPVPQQPTIEQFLPPPPRTPAKPVNNGSRGGMFLGWILVVILGIIILERIANPVSTTPIVAIVIFGPIALVFLACGYPRRAGRIVRKVLPFVGAKGRRAHAEEQRAMRQRYEQALQQWQATVSEIAKRSADRRTEYRNALQGWERDRAAFLQLQDVNNAELKTLKQQYEAGPTVPASKAVVEFLMRRNLEELSDDYTVSFLSEGQLLLVDLDLPSKTLLPQYKMGKTKAVALSDKWKRETYEKALYETTLLSLSRVFRSDYKA